MKGLTLKQVIDADAKIGAGQAAARREQTTTVRLAIVLLGSALTTFEMLVASGVIGLPAKRKAAVTKALRVVRAVVTKLSA